MRPWHPPSRTLSLSLLGVGKICPVHWRMSTRWHPQSPRRNPWSSPDAPVAAAPSLRPGSVHCDLASAFDVPHSQDLHSVVNTTHGQGRAVGLMSTLPKLRSTMQNACAFSQTSPSDSSQPTSRRRSTGLDQDRTWRLKGKRREGDGVAGRRERRGNKGHGNDRIQTSSKSMPKFFVILASLPS